MQFCQDHWQRLRTAISDRGLDHLVAQTDKRAFENMKDQLETDDHSLRTFDPLMGAFYAIVNNLADTARRFGGSAEALHIMTGDCCPICYANDRHQEQCQDPDCTFTYDDWIIQAADDMKVEADRLASLG